MRITAFILLSAITGWLGLTYGAAIGGFGVCEASISSRFVLIVLSIGSIFTVLSASFGRKIGWIVPTIYCFPIIALGALMPSEWQRIATAWIAVLGIGLVYLACLRYFPKPTNKPD